MTCPLHVTIEEPREMELNPARATLQAWRYVPSPEQDIFMAVDGTSHQVKDDHTRGAVLSIACRAALKARA